MASLLAKKPITILNHALRAVLVLVCLSMALGNSLAALMVNMQATSFCQSAPTEELPIEEAPPEAELPSELIELDEFSTHGSSQSQRRKVVSMLRQFLRVKHCNWTCSYRAEPQASRAILQRHNGCGAALRC